MQVTEELFASPRITKSPNVNTNSPAGITLRRASFLDARAISRVAAKTYLDTPLSDFLSPYRRNYPSEFERGFYQRGTIRLCSPRNRSYLAVLQENGRERVVGSAQYVRLGDDYGARSQIRSQGLIWRLLLFFVGWFYRLYFKILGVLTGPLKSEDPEANRLFLKWGDVEGKKHWDFDERRDRWHALSVFVDLDFHRRGIGRLLMSEIMKMADKEGVCIGLESSGPGEYLYRSLGFELLGRFEKGNFEEGGGGVMIYRPKGFVDKSD